MTSTVYTKRIVIIAGPNGAGKTTFAREFLPTDAELPNFVNADLIAAGLSRTDDSGLAFFRLFGEVDLLVLAECRDRIGARGYTGDTGWSQRS